MILSFNGFSEDLSYGMEKIAKKLNFELGKDGFLFNVEHCEAGISIAWDGKKGKIAYAKPNQFFRAIGLVVEKLNDSDAPFSIEEMPCYNTLGLMLDCSRNAVVTFDTFMDIAERLALMGYSMIQLYTEDTFEMEEYPYFGYMRPRLSKAEIKKMDEYAKCFGIELTPCIQTLAHLNCFLQWSKCGVPVDTGDILLVGEDATYEFIECEFKTMAECFTSRRINIGLDEAFMLGRGNYLTKNGYEDRFDIMMKHCKRVFEIARRYDFKPMMWSDMFFRLSSPAGAYYHIDKPIDSRVTENYPKDVQLIYWDYYNYNSELLDGMFKLHKDITEDVVFAPGAWKWSGFSPNNRFAEKTCRAQHVSCKKFGVTDIIVTAWGDNGNLASNYSMMPNVQLWAELCYKGNSDDISKRFRTCMDADYEQFYNLDMPGIITKDGEPKAGSENPELYLLYQDVLMGLFDKHVSSHYSDHYKKWADKFDEYAKTDTKWGYLFELQKNLCRVLELKCDMGVKLYDAYHNKDIGTIRKIAEETLPETIERFHELRESVTHQWENENRIIGLDSLDIKLGGVLARLEAANRRLKKYVSGEIDVLDELEVEKLPFKKTHRDDDPVTAHNIWVSNVTANVLK